jgi:outer membrane immunogenic protein
MIMIRTGILGLTLCSALAFAANSAYAADIYRHESLKDTPAPYIQAPSSSWTGFYIGGHLGGAWDNNDDVRSFSSVAGGRIKDDNSDGDFIGGVHVGYNWQRYGSPLVLGIEGDLDFSDRIDTLATVRGRLGYATERALLYVTAGVAFKDGDDRDLKFTSPNGNFTFPSGADSDDTGWVVGGGAEYKVSSNWSLGIEGLYYNFDGDGAVGAAGIGGSSAAYRVDGEDNFWQVRGRLTYHLGHGYEPLK